MQLPTPLLNRGYTVDGDTAYRAYPHGFRVELETLTTLTAPIGLLDAVINDTDSAWAYSDVEQFDTIWHIRVTDIRGDILLSQYSFVTYYMVDTVREIHNNLSGITVDQAIEYSNGTTELCGSW